MDTTVRKTGAVWPRYIYMLGTDITYWHHQERIRLHPSIKDRDAGRDLSFYMDLLSHDILNGNQAILSYIDLIMAEQHQDGPGQRHALKAASQVRVLSKLFESIRVLCPLMRGEPAPSDEVRLRDCLGQASTDLADMFPDRSVEVDSNRLPADAVVAGGRLATGAISNLLMNIVQLDPADRVVIELEASETERGGRRFWSVRARTANSKVPPSLATRESGGENADSRSRMVRIGGFLLAKVMAESLGGSFDAKDEKGGSSFTLLLPGAGSP